MFKKLKQKIEDGGDGGLEKVSFSPTKLPGSIVRANSPGTGARVSNSPELDFTLDQTAQLPSPPPEVCLKRDEQCDGIPTHLNSSLHISYQAQLQGRVRELEQECAALKVQLREESSQTTVKQNECERIIAELDQQRTELKMEVVELELERTGSLQEYEMKCKAMQNQLMEQEEAANDHQSMLVVQVNQLKEQIEAKEKCIIEQENRHTALEKKVHHYQSQLEAYENSSENEVVNRLHHEVAENEQRVKTRNIEIQILERRLASQAKENGDHMEKFLNEQKELERVQREAVCLAKEEKSARKGLLKELEVLQHKYTLLEKEKDDVMAQLAVRTEGQQKLAYEYQQMQSYCDTKIQDLDHIIEDKEDRIKELLHQLKLQSEHSIVEPIPRPPGVARRTASVGVQTEPRTLQAHEGQSNFTPQEVAVNRKDSLDMDTLQQQQQQCKLEEELAEKVKIIKVQQQKIMDIRKELRLKVVSDQKSCYDVNHSPPPPPSLDTSNSTTPDVNFQYLKHVVIKFVCSREDEALQLIRAISTLLEFSPQEEKHVRRYLNYKMSWFGAIPPPLFPPAQTNSHVSSTNDYS